jgi:hypothetical protein
MQGRGGRSGKENESKAKQSKAKQRNARLGEEKKDITKHCMAENRKTEQSI